MPTIAGHRAIFVRTLLRAARSGIDLGEAARRLGCDRASASKTLRTLATLGYLAAAEHGRYGTTIAGEAVASARANAPIRRATADRLVAALMERAQVIENDARFTHVVKRLTVTGAYLDPECERVAVIVVIVEVEPRRFGHTGPDARAAEGTIAKFLRARAKHLYFSSPLERVHGAQCVIYERPPLSSEGARASRRGARGSARTLVAPRRHR